MSHVKIVAHLQSLIAAVTMPEELQDTLASVATSGNPVVAAASKVAVGGSNQAQQAALNEYQGALASLVKELLRITPGTFYRHLHKLQAGLAQWEREASPDDAVALATALESAHMLEERYNAFYGSHSRQDAFLIQNLARDLIRLLSALEASGRALLDAATSLQDLPAVYLDLQLGFGREPTAPELLSILDVLNGCYEDLCRIAEVSHLEYPLRIRYIEAGSVNLDLGGHTLVIGLLVAMLKSIAGLAYRSFTREGQILDLRSRVDMADDIVRLLDELKARGLESPLAEDELRELGNSLASRAAQLMAGSSVFVLDGVTYQAPSQIPRRGLPPSTTSEE